MNRPAIGVYKTEPDSGMRWAAYDKEGVAWRIGEAEAVEIRKALIAAKEAPKK